MPRFSGRSSRGFGASGAFPGGLGSAVAVLEYAAQERVMAQYLYEHAGVPTDGTNGTYAHVAPPGALLINTDAKTLYQNTGTQASPVWTERSAASGGGSGVQVTDPPIDVSSAELLVLHDTPKILRAAVPGVLHVPVKLLLNFDSNTIPYSDGGLLYVGYLQDNGTVLNEWEEPPGPLVTGGTALSVIPCDTLQEDPATSVGKALAITNKIANYTAGNGTLQVTVASLPVNVG